MLIKREYVLQIMPNAKYAYGNTGTSRVDKFLRYIQETCEEFDINTPKRVAHFLAQIAHESAELRTVEENLMYSAKALQQTWPSRFNAANAAQYAYKPEKIANKVYANRMGNGDEASGDGYKYRGRGAIQLTGKNNYSAYSKYCGYDLLKMPDLLAQPKGAIRSAGWFWKKSGLNELADKDDIVAITKKINGGQNGIAERKKYLARAKK